MADLCVFKYKFEITDEQIIEMPAGAKVLTVAQQHKDMCLWALVNPLREPVKLRLWIVGTGHPAGHVAGMRYIGTFMLHDGQLVFHVFMEEDNG